MITCRPTSLACLLGVGASLALGVPAQAQRRGDSGAAGHLEIVFESPVKLGDVVLSAKRYRLSVSKRGVSFIHPTTMVAEATLPAQESQAKTVAPKPVAKLELNKAGEVVLTVHTGDRLYTLKGVPATAPASQGQVELASSQQANLGDVLPQAESTLELIQESLAKRWVKDVKHCADMAHRSRWVTDDKRFIACVCPIADRWRLPAAEPTLRVHHALAKGKSGLSLTVDGKGKVSNCRVWVGAKPPA